MLNIQKVSGRLARECNKTDQEENDAQSCKSKVSANKGRKIVNFHFFLFPFF